MNCRRCHKPSTNPDHCDKCGEVFKSTDHPVLNKLYPVVLYFDSREEADQFIEMVQKAVPGLRAENLK